MITLLFFAFVAGIVTALSPCILPVLPLLLAAGSGQGRYRPYAIIVGLVISFTFFTLALTALVQSTHVSPTILRNTAIGLIIFFGLTMIFPTLEQAFARLTSPLARLGSKLENVSTSTTGVVSGLIFGSALGLIWAPCAGPILATISTLAATGNVTLEAVIVTLAYSVGTALPMFFIIYGGGKIVSVLGPYTEIIRKVFGVLMILGALAIAIHAEVYFQQLAIKYIPAINTENNKFVQQELQQLRKKDSMNNQAPTINSKAPEFVGISAWINSNPLTIDALKGKVVLVDFWTYSCINCVRTLPYLKRWYQDYKDKGFTIVGVHTPEFAFEHEKQNVQDAVKRFEISYPVALDNNFSTWNNYDNHYWPAHYLIDQNGIIQDIHFGEGEYDKTENKIRALLGLIPLTEKPQLHSRVELTPETYLGYSRVGSYMPTTAIKKDQESIYMFGGKLSQDSVALQGNWLVSGESITSKDDSAQLIINCSAQHVYLVMSAEQPAPVTVLIDNKPTADTILVKESRMYTVADFKEPGRHTVTLSVPRGVSLYAFTFGAD